MAVSLKGGRGLLLLVAEDAHVESVTGNIAQLRVPPRSALLIQEAALMGPLSYISLPAEGASPFQGQALDDVSELERRILEHQRRQLGSNVAPQVQRTAVEKKAPKRFRSYAWVTGDKLMFAVDKHGEVVVIDQQGRESPLEIQREELDPEPYSRRAIPNDAWRFQDEDS